jgi:putative transposase
MGISSAEWGCLWQWGDRKRPWYCGHPRVKRWLAARPRFSVHFTPTYASWLNQVEIWFNRITQQAIRRGTFRSVKELVEKIDQYVRTSNNQAQPFVWTATADSIFAKVQRLCERISGTGH